MIQTRGLTNPTTSHLPAEACGSKSRKIFIPSELDSEESKEGMFRQDTLHGKKRFFNRSMCEECVKELPITQEKYLFSLYY